MLTLANGFILSLSCSAVIRVPVHVSTSCIEDIKGMKKPCSELWAEVNAVTNAFLPPLPVVMVRFLTPLCEFVPCT